MNLHKLDLVFSLMLGALGVYILFKALSYGVVSANITGSGFFPFLSGILILAGIGGTFLDRTKGKRIVEGTLSRAEFVPVAMITLATVVFLLLVTPVGMLVLTPFYIFAVAAAIKPPRNLRSLVAHLATAIGFTIVAWALFGLTLKVPLPAGLLAAAG